MIARDHAPAMGAGGLLCLAVALALSAPALAAETDGGADGDSRSYFYDSSVIADGRGAPSTGAPGNSHLAGPLRPEPPSAPPAW